MKYYILLTIVILSLSCSNTEEQKSRKKKEIENFIDIWEKDKNEENSKKMVSIYNNFAKSFPKDTNTPKYLFEAAKINYNILKNNKNAAKIYQNIVEKYTEFREIDQIIINYGMILFFELKERKKAKNIFLMMPQKKPKSELAYIAQFMATDSINAKNKIRELQEIFEKDAQKGIFDVKKTEKLASLFLLYAQKYPKHKVSPKFMLNAASLTNGILKQAKKAAQIYLIIRKNYKNTKFAATAIFAAANIYKDNLNEKEKAKILLKEFIEKYPENELIKDAKILLKNIDKDISQILTDIENKNKK